MSAVIVDIRDGNEGNVSSREGWSLTRIARITGVTGTGHAKIKAAYNALVNALGGLGTQHPTVTTAVISGFHLSNISDTVIEAQITYSQPLPGRAEGEETREVNTSLSQVETNKDKDGHLITLSYKYPDDYKLDERKQGKTIEQGGTVSKLYPQTSLVITRTESSFPGGKSRQYTGKVNNGGWWGDLTAAPRTWMVMSIIGRSNDGGETYEVVYTFQYLEDTWHETALFVNPDDGKPPADLVNDEGIKIVQLYEEVDFNTVCPEVV